MFDVVVAHVSGYFKSQPLIAGAVCFLLGAVFF